MKTRFVSLTLVLGLTVAAHYAAAQSAEPTFDALDKNHDGVLSKDEVAAMFPANGGRMGDSSGGGQRHAGGGFGGGFGGGGPGGGGFGGRGGGTMHGPGSAHGGTQGGGARSGKAPNIDAIFKSWDKDGNGTISREEFDARPHANAGGRRHGAPAGSDDREPPHL